MKLFLIFLALSIFLFSISMADDKPISKAEDKTIVLSKDSIDKIKDTSIDSTQAITDKIVAYYFHSTRRCVTCKKIEAYSREAIESKFDKELESGLLEFKPINFDEEENEHFIKDYALYTKSLVICDYKKGKQIKWKNLEKIWELVNDKEDFLKYVQDEISNYLDEGSDE